MSGRSLVIHGGQSELSLSTESGDLAKGSQVLAEGKRDNGDIKLAHVVRKATKPGQEGQFVVKFGDGGKLVARNIVRLGDVVLAERTKGNKDFIRATLLRKSGQLEHKWVVKFHDETGSCVARGLKQLRCFFGALKRWEEDDSWVEAAAVGDAKEELKQLMKRRLPDIIALGLLQNMSRGAWQTLVSELPDMIDDEVAIEYLVNGDGWKSAIEQSQFSLDLTGTQISDETLKSLAGKLPELGTKLKKIELVVQQVDGTTEAGFAEFYKHPVPDDILPIKNLVTDFDKLSDVVLKPYVRQVAKMKGDQKVEVDFMYVTDNTLEELARCCPKLSKLSVMGCWDVTIEGIRMVIKNCKEIKQLCVRGCAQFQQDAEACNMLMELISRYCRDLQKLDIRDTLVDMRGAIKVLHNCKKITLETLRLGGKNDKALKNHDLIVAYIDSRDDFDSITLLNMNGYSIDQPDRLADAIAARCPLLTKLDIRNTRMEASSLARILPHCRKLRLEQVKAESRKITNRVVEAYGKAHPELQEVDLRRCAVDEIGLSAILHDCQYLKLIGRDALQDDRAIHEAGGPLSVSDVQLSFSSGSESGAKRSRRRTRKAANFEGEYDSDQDTDPYQKSRDDDDDTPKNGGLFIERRKITDRLIEVYLTVQRQNFSIEQLDLRFTRVGDQSLMQIARFCGQQLNYLNVTGCVDVTPDGLVWVAMQCNHLHLNVGIAEKPTLQVEPRKITDAVIQAYAKSHPNTEELDLSGTAVRDAALVGLAKNCRQLRALNLSATAVTQDGLVSLMECPELKLGPKDQLVDLGPEIKHAVSFLLANAHTQRLMVLEQAESNTDAELKRWNEDTTDLLQFLESEVVVGDRIQLVDFQKFWRNVNKQRRWEHRAEVSPRLLGCSSGIVQHINDQTGTFVVQFSIGTHDTELLDEVEIEEVEREDGYKDNWWRSATAKQYLTHFYSSEKYEEYLRGNWRKEDARDPDVKDDTMAKQNSYFDAIKENWKGARVAWLEPLRKQHSRTDRRSKWDEDVSLPWGYDDPSAPEIRVQTGIVVDRQGLLFKIAVDSDRQRFTKRTTDCLALHVSNVDHPDHRNWRAYMEKNDWRWQQYLKLDSRRQISDRVLCAYAQHHVQTVHLDLSGCSDVTDNGLMNVAEHCHNLRKISFEGTDATEDGLVYLVELCQLLSLAALEEAAAAFLAPGEPLPKQVTYVYAQSAYLYAKKVFWDAFKVAAAELAANRVGSLSEGFLVAGDGSMWTDQHQDPRDDRVHWNTHQRGVWGQMSDNRHLSVKVVGICRCQTPSNCQCMAVRYDGVTGIADMTRTSQQKRDDTFRVRLSRDELHKRFPTQFPSKYDKPQAWQESHESDQVVLLHNDQLSFHSEHVVECKLCDRPTNGPCSCRKNCGHDKVQQYISEALQRADIRVAKELEPLTQVERSMQIQRQWICEFKDRMINASIGKHRDFVLARTLQHALMNYGRAAEKLEHALRDALDAVDVFPRFKNRAEYALGVMDSVLLNETRNRWDYLRRMVTGVRETTKLWWVKRVSRNLAFGKIKHRWRECFVRNHMNECFIHVHKCDKKRLKKMDELDLIDELRRRGLADESSFRQSKEDLLSLLYDDNDSDESDDDGVYDDDDSLYLGHKRGAGVFTKDFRVAKAGKEGVRNIVAGVKPGNLDESESTIQRRSSISSLGAAEAAADRAIRHSVDGQSHSNSRLDGNNALQKKDLGKIPGISKPRTGLLGGGGETIIAAEYGHHRVMNAFYRRYPLTQMSSVLSASIISELDLTTFRIPKVTAASAKGVRSCAESAPQIRVQLPYVSENKPYQQFYRATQAPLDDKHAFAGGNVRTKYIEIARASMTPDNKSETGFQWNLGVGAQNGPAFLHTSPGYGRIKCYTWVHADALAQKVEGVERQYAEHWSGVYNQELALANVDKKKKTKTTGSAKIIACCVTRIRPQCAWCSRTDPGGPKTSKSKLCDGLVCSLCRSVFYCDKQCQKNDWRRHRSKEGGCQKIHKERAKQFSQAMTDSGQEVSKEAYFEVHFDCRDAKQKQCELTDHTHDQYLSERNPTTQYDVLTDDGTPEKMFGSQIGLNTEKGFIEGLCRPPALHPYVSAVENEEPRAKWPDDLVIDVTPPQLGLSTSSRLKWEEEGPDTSTWYRLKDLRNFDIGNSKPHQPPSDRTSVVAMNYVAKKLSKKAINKVETIKSDLRNDHVSLKIRKAKTKALQDNLNKKAKTGGIEAPTTALEMVEDSGPIQLTVKGKKFLLRSESKEELEEWYWILMASKDKPKKIATQKNWRDRVRTPTWHERETGSKAIVGRQNKMKSRMGTTFDPSVTSKQSRKSFQAKVQGATASKSLPAGQKYLT